MIDTKELHALEKRLIECGIEPRLVHAAADELDALRANEQWHRDENDKARKYANELHNENEKLRARVEELKGVETSLRNQQQAFESQLQYNIDRRIAMQDELASLQQQLERSRGETDRIEGKYDVVQQQLAEAREDTRLIDWLNRNTIGVVKVINYLQENRTDIAFQFRATVPVSIGEFDFRSLSKLAAIEAASKEGK